MNRIGPLLLIFIASVSSAQYKNIQLTGQIDSNQPIRPTIAINKSNLKNIVAGIGPDLITFTQDAGINWKTASLKYPLGTYDYPVIISNAKGHLFWFHSSDPSGKEKNNNTWLDQVIIHRSDDEGETWSEGTPIGNNPRKDRHNVWPIVHPKRNFMCVTWTQYDTYGSNADGCQSQIMFSKSLNGTSWSKPVIISETPGDCLDQNNTVKGAMTVIGSDGKIYTTWANREKIYLDRSYDNGSTWLQNDIVITQHEVKKELNQSASVDYGTPVLALDDSEGRFKGTMYLAWADQKNGATDTDIWLIRSRNRGDFWGKPQRINQDSTRTHQYSPWITVDQTNGNVYLVYFDQRESAETNQTNVYLAYSTNGGNNFNEVKISDSPFTPDVNHWLENHTGIDAHAGLITPIWTRTDNGHTSIETALIKEEELIKKTSSSATHKKKK